MEGKNSGGSSFKSNFVSRLLTLIPRGITWLLLDFVFRQLRGGAVHNSCLYSSSIRNR